MALSKRKKAETLGKAVHEYARQKKKKKIQQYNKARQKDHDPKKSDNMICMYSNKRGGEEGKK